MVLEPSVDPCDCMADTGFERAAVAVLDAAVGRAVAQLVMRPGKGLLLIWVAVDVQIRADQNGNAGTPVFSMVAESADAARIVRRGPRKLHRDVDAVQDVPPESVPPDVPCDPCERVGAVSAMATVSHRQHRITEYGAVMSKRELQMTVDTVGWGAEKTCMTLAFWGDTSRTAGFWTGEGSGTAVAGVDGAGAVARAFMEAAAEAVDEGLLVRGDGAVCAVPGVTGAADGAGDEWPLSADACKPQLGSPC